MIQPTALNFVVVGLMVTIFLFMTRQLASFLVDRNPESGLGKGIGALVA